MSFSSSTFLQMNHNLWLRYSVLRKEQSTVCLSCFHWEAYLRFLFINCAAAMAAEFGKTRKQIVTHKCANTWL